MNRNPFIIFVNYFFYRIFNFFSLIHYILYYDEAEENNKYKIILPEKKVIKYEDKYLTDLDKEFVFTEEENIVYQSQIDEIYTTLFNKTSQQLADINQEFKETDKLLVKYTNYDDDYCIYDDDELSGIGLYEICDTKEDIIYYLTQSKEKYSIEINTITDTLTDTIELRNQAAIQAKAAIIKTRLSTLKNNFVMEYTPLGNVLMVYDADRETFKYFSDSTIPYRYLEVVGRKYVKQFNCGPLFVNMTEEILLAEEKWDKKIAEEEKYKKDGKKSVFTKFKSYNNNNRGCGPKNSIPNTNSTNNTSGSKIILKNKTNRYTYEGKIINFSFLKKIDRKVVDKKYAMSFSDFKKIQSKNVKM